eukprot:7291929-Pyramimonas_sp.AAC.2
MRRRRRREEGEDEDGGKGRKGSWRMWDDDWSASAVIIGLGVKEERELENMWGGGVRGPQDSSYWHSGSHSDSPPSCSSATNARDGVDDSHGEVGLECGP